jgi:molybdenum cofactor guanylyltransferase
MASTLVVGLFVGGRGLRMGGVAKGNLRLASGVRLIERLARVCRAALPEAPIVLVGRSDAYADLGFFALRDAPAGIGPLGGLRALLTYARDQGSSSALALACDMPFVTPNLVRRLASEAPDALALAAREHGFWHALGARYSTRVTGHLDAAVEAEEHSLQGIFARLGDGARALEVGRAELDALADWDTPEDIAS